LLFKVKEADLELVFLHIEESLMPFGTQGAKRNADSHAASFTICLLEKARRQQKCESAYLLAGFHDFLISEGIFQGKVCYYYYYYYYFKLIFFVFFYDFEALILKIILTLMHLQMIHFEK
jgi:hypothetical protein